MWHLISHLLLAVTPSVDAGTDSGAGDNASAIITRGLLWLAVSVVLAVLLVFLLLGLLWVVINALGLPQSDLYGEAFGQFLRVVMYGSVFLLIWYWLSQNKNKHPTQVKWLLYIIMGILILAIGSSFLLAVATIIRAVTGI